MENSNDFNFAQLLAIVTVLSSAISIIINKLFENRQNLLKHKRIIEEKIIEAKIDACVSAIKYYGTVLNYLYNSKSTLESSKSHEYSLLLNESQTSYEKLLRKIQFEGDGEFHKISLFYDFYENKDEEIAEKIRNSQKEYFEYITEATVTGNFERENELRLNWIRTTNEAIKYFKCMIKVVRDDLNKNAK